ARDATDVLFGETKRVISGSSPDPLRNAKLTDWPHTTLTNVHYTSETAIFSDSVPQKGWFYGCIIWGLSIDKNGVVSLDTPRYSNFPSDNWFSARDKWNATTGKEKMDYTWLPPDNKDYRISD